MSTVPPTQPTGNPVVISPEIQGASTTALILEIVFGIFGLLGIGHAFTGRIRLAIGLLLGWWGYILVAWLISAATLGFAACLLIPIGIAAPVISGIQARTYVLTTGETGSWPTVAKVAGGGCLTLILGMILLAILGAVLRGFQSGY